MAEGKRVLRRVPWVLWAALIAAAIIGGVQLCRGEGRTVELVGAGPLGSVREGDAPEGARYVVRTRSSEPLADTGRRIDRAISEWPDVIVIGLDGDQVVDVPSADRARRILAEATRRAENATAVPVVLGFAPGAEGSDGEEPLRDLQRWWRTELCAQKGLRLCVDIAPHAGDPGAVRAAVATAVVDALGRHAVLRASTQGER
ncbi:MAG: hypothetical protein ACOCV4_07790 [Myxococcota bacterium]